MTGVQTCALPICFPVTISRKAIIATGSKIWSIEGITNTLGYLNKNGFAGTVVRFVTAKGKMELDGKAFIMWGSRMARLINA